MAKQPKDITILIIDDEKINRTLLHQTVLSCNCTVQVVAVDNACEALFHYFTGHFDLVFLDIMMPEIDGNDFLTIIEKNIAAGNLIHPSDIVVQTAIQSIEELSALTNRECVQEVMRKPLAPSRIKECVERYCL